MNWAEKFNKVDHSVALLMSKIGLKNQAVLLSPTDEQYWISIIKRWQALRVMFVFAYIPFGVYMVYNADNMKYLNPLQFGVPFSIFIFLALTCYHVEIILYGFERGREQKKKGNTEINGSHICKMLIFPAFFSICLLLPFVMALYTR